MLKRAIVRTVLLPVIRSEVPGWGRLYEKFIGSWRDNDFWKEEPPRIIRDKRCGYYRIVNISEWADRALYFLGRWYDLEAALLVEALVQEGDRVLDVGANYGHFSLAAAKAVGPSGSVVSLEPNPKAFARLSIHLVLNGLSWVEAKNIGVSDTEGRLALSVPSINSGEATFGASKYEDVFVIEVPVQRLDDIASHEKVHFLKIDVEGFEVHVLRGAKALLDRDRPIVLSEVVEKHLASAGESRRSLSRFLEDRGYKSFRLGLKGRGASQRLSLEAMPAIECDGDFLWVPQDKEDQISTFVR